MKLRTLLIFWLMMVCHLATAQNCEADYQNKLWQQAFSSCQAALEKNPPPEYQLATLDRLAHISDYLGRNQDTERYDELIQNHPLFNHTAVYPYNWYRRAGKRAFYKQQADQAQAYFQAALEIAKQQANPVWQGKSHNDLGVLLNQRNQYTSALSHYQQSLAIKLQQSDDLIIANTQYNVGSLLLKLERPDEALDYLKRAISSYQKHAEVNNQVDQVSLEQNIEHVYEDLIVAHLKLDQSEQAAQYIKQMLKVESQQGAESIHVDHASANLVLAKFYLSEHEPELAQALLNRAVDMAPNENALSVALESVKIKAMMKQVSIAIELAQRGLLQAETQQDLFFQAAFNQQLGQLLEPDNPTAALPYFKAFHQAREAFLEQKYNEDIDTINFNIKSQQIEHDLIEEQLINTQKEKQIVNLTNWILLATLVLLVLFMIFAYDSLQKNKEKQALIKSIEYHKNQLFLLNTANDQAKAETEKMPTKQGFKETLIKAMVEAVDVWNRHTGQNRIDLAEKSKIWTITIDNGVLRARSMDKYLSIQQIPENPRWRKVVRTCHFILSDSSLNASDRALLNSNLEQIMDMIKGLSQNPS